MKEKCNYFATFDVFATYDPFATFNWRWDSGIWIISILGDSVSYLFEKITSEGKHINWEILIQSKRQIRKQNIVFPDINASIELYWLYERFDRGV